MDVHLIAYYIGILIVIGTHVYMLAMPAPMNTRMVQMHAGINIVGALLIAYHFMWSQGMISF
jgi:hypothetical protein